VGGERDAHEFRKLPLKSSPVVLRERPNGAIIHRRHSAILGVVEVERHVRDRPLNLDRIDLLEAADPILIAVPTAASDRIGDALKLRVIRVADEVGCAALHNEGSD